MKILHSVCPSLQSPNLFKLFVVKVDALNVGLAEALGHGEEDTVLYLGSQMFHWEKKYSTIEIEGL